MKNQIKKYENYEELEVLNSNEIIEFIDYLEFHSLLCEKKILKDITLFAKPGQKILKEMIENGMKESEFLNPEKFQEKSKLCQTYHYEALRYNIDNYFLESLLENNHIYTLIKAFEASKGLMLIDYKEYKNLRKIDLEYLLVELYKIRPED